MSPAQRAAETRRRNRDAIRAETLRESLPERRKACVRLLAEVLQRAQVLAALPAVEPTEALIEIVHALDSAAGDLWSKLHWWRDWVQELEELQRDGALPEATNVIRFPRRTT